MRSGQAGGSAPEVIEAVVAQLERPLPLPLVGGLAAGNLCAGRGGDVPEGLLKDSDESPIGEGFGEGEERDPAEDAMEDGPGQGVSAHGLGGRGGAVHGLEQPSQSALFGGVEAAVGVDGEGLPEEIEVLSFWSGAGLVEASDDLDKA